MSKQSLFVSTSEHIWCKVNCGTSSMLECPDESGVLNSGAISLKAFYHRLLWITIEL